MIDTGVLDWGIPPRMEEAAISGGLLAARPTYMFTNKRIDCGGVICLLKNT